MSTKPLNPTESDEPSRHPRRVREYTCVKCGKTFLSKANRVSYCEDCRRPSGPRQAKTYTCRRCGQTFQSKANRALYCEDCRAQLRRDYWHQRRVENKNSRTCIVCGKTFYTHGNSTQRCCSESCQNQAIEQNIPISINTITRVYVSFPSDSIELLHKLRKKGLVRRSLSRFINDALCFYLQSDNFADDDADVKAILSILLKKNSTKK